MWPRLSGPAVVCEGMLDMISRPRLLGSSGVSLFLSYQLLFQSLCLCYKHWNHFCFIFSISENYLGIYLSLK